MFFLVCTIGYSGTTGKISGTVTDATSGEPLIGVNIIVENTIFGAATDSQGDYYIINIEPGKYTVVASMIGYSSLRVGNVRIIPDHTTNVDFKLTSSVLEGEEVTVIAERPLIQFDETFSSTVISAEEINNMPINSYSEVLSNTAGIVVTNDGNNTSLQLRGGRASDLSYMVDGFHVSDPYWGTAIVDVTNQGIQDISIIAGTFNAEYGEAGSGIVNIVTKEGTNRFSGMVRTSTDQFGVDSYNFGTMRLESTLSGPLPFLGKKGNFFISGDNLSTDTYLRYLTTNVHDVDGNPITRDHDFKLFLDRKRYTGKIVLRPIIPIKLIFGINHHSSEERDYSHAYKEIPEQNGVNFNTTNLMHFTLTHTLSPKTYYELKFSNFEHHFEHNMPNTRLDDYINPLTVGDAFDGTSNYEFYGDYISEIAYDTTVVNDEEVITADTTWVISSDWRWEDRKTQTSTIAANFVSQINKNHMIKTGIEYKSHRIRQHYITYPNQYGIGKPYTVTKYDFEPMKFSAYFQDKMEFDDFVLNAGVRLDYLDPNSKYAPDLSKPQELEEAEASYKISPRLGFGYPVTENIRFHFAYGHFYRFPEFHKLYNRFNVADTSAAPINVTIGYRPQIGNPALKPETHIQYETGVQIALSQETVASVTLYYKDTYDYVGTKFYDVDPATYFASVNMDYANTRGIEFCFEKRFSNNYSGKVNYTYSKAEGNASDYLTHVNEYQMASVTGQIIPKKTVTLPWDQPHTLNFQFDVRWPDNWGMNVVSTFGSGLPYTPTDARGKAVGEVNSARQPWTGTVDVRFNKDFHFFGLKEIFFVNIWNLLDKKNVYNVFTNSGKPDYSMNPNSSEELMFDPENFGPPRQIEVGLEIRF
jgi:outer membrane receptor protein involved in Fe transport